MTLLLSVSIQLFQSTVGIFSSTEGSFGNTASWRWHLFTLIWIKQTRNAMNHLYPYPSEDRSVARWRETHFYICLSSSIQSAQQRKGLQPFLGESNNSQWDWRTVFTFSTFKINKYIESKMGVYTFMSSMDNCVDKNIYLSYVVQRVLLNISRHIGLRWKRGGPQLPPLREFQRLGVPVEKASNEDPGSNGRKEAILCGKKRRRC